jgi:hypothetical protein
LGAGVQSTTIALMGLKNWEYWGCSEPMPYPAVGLIDYAIFADTQEEPRKVYRHLDWLMNEVGRFIEVKVGSLCSLGDQLIDGVNPNDSFRFVSIPAFTTAQEGTPQGITRRQCTRDFKIDVIERIVRREILGLKPGQRIPKQSDITRLMGLSYDEAGRIARVNAANAGSPFEWRYPLFEMEMTRGGCKTWLRKHYPHREIPRSACVFCPYHSNAEWRVIKEVPEDWARAVQIDKAIRDHDSTCTRGLNQKQYVHSSCVPLEEADLDDPETKERRRGQEMFGFLQECEGMCGV